MSLQNNAFAQIGDCDAKKYEIAFELVDHLFYSPNFSPLDFYLITKVKNHLKSKRFSIDLIKKLYIPCKKLCLISKILF